MKKRFRNIGILMLSICLVAASPMAAAGEEIQDPEISVVDNLVQPREGTAELQCTDAGDGHISLELKNYTRPSDVTAVYFAVWSENGGQDDLMWYQADAQNAYQMDTALHYDDLGKYKIDAYQKKNSGAMEFLVSGSVVVSAVNRPAPLISASASDTSEKLFSIEVSGYEMPANGAALYAAVWSTANGQDDITWMVMQKKSTGSYYAACEPSAHKTVGQYLAHIYLQYRNGKMKFIGGTEFQVSGISCGSIEVKNQDLEAGTCEIFVNGVTSPSGMKKVMVPVWNSPDQSDIVWYTAENMGNDTYRVKMNVANHKYHAGKYYIDVYATNGNNITEFLGSQTVTYESPRASVSQESGSGGYRLKADNIVVAGTIRQIYFAVWSTANGQDDLRWITAPYNTAAKSGEAVLALKNCKDYGDYKVDAYAQMPSGQMLFLGGTGFHIAEPSMQTLDISTDNAAGTFRISAENVICEKGIQDLRIAVWSASNQSDIVWYTASSVDKKTYVVNSSIARHKYNVGSYHAHVYLTDTDGRTAFLGGRDFTFEVIKGTVELGESQDETLYQVLMKDMIVPAGAQRIRMAVWSETGGQDDLCWYDAAAEGEALYKACVDIRKHKTAGKYRIDVYAQTKGGQMVFLGGNQELEVNSSASVEINASDPNKNDDSFDFTLTLSDETSGISTVRVPVWCASDQSDIVWYQAKKQNDHTYTLTVPASAHKGNLGTYKIHVYVTFNNGITAFAGAENYQFNPENCLMVVSDSAWGTRRVLLKNAPAGTTKVQFPVWSIVNGQDDIVWYDAVKTAAGDWEALIRINNHKSPGQFVVHAYADGVAVRSAYFTVQASEFLKNGWYYENGYKFYYENGVKLTDVSSILGPQAEYMAKVNRTACTVTIYARDGGNGFIIPVKAFACSVGLPDTPTPAGTYHTLAKYRWHELMGPSYGQYCTRIVGGVLFHSVAGANMTSYNLSAVEYNKLGSPASHGCVRLCVRDAKWIYDNCSLGMTVVIYDSADPGPLGKPDTIKIPMGQNWDPTDPNL